MKQTIAFAIAAMFIFSLLPLALGEEATNQGVSIRDTTKIKVDTQASEKRGESISRIRDKAISKPEGIEKLSNLSNERLQKIAELDKRQIEKLNKLNIRNLDKITSLKQERLERLTRLNEEKLERLSELKEKELENISGLNETDLEKVATLNRARLKGLAKFDDERLKKELRAIEILKVKSANQLNKRAITEDRLAKVKEIFEQSKREFKETKDELNDARKILKDAIDKRDEKASLSAAKTYLLKSAELIIKHLEKIKSKVQESENISDETEAKIVAEIDSQIADIQKIKAEVESATTKEQVKEVAKKLHEKLRGLKPRINLHTQVVVSARVNGITNNGIVLEKRLDHILAKAKEKGIEINVSTELDAFSEKIELSKEKGKQAQVKLSEALALKAESGQDNSTRIRIKQLMDEANALIRESRNALKEAHGILKTIVRKIKEADAGADLSTEFEVEVEEQS